MFFGGGNDGTTPAATIDVYNSLADVWSLVHLSTARSQLSIAATTNSVLFAGGVNSNGDLSAVVDALKLTERAVNVPINP